MAIPIVYGGLSMENREISGMAECDFFMMSSNSLTISGC